MLTMKEKTNLALKWRRHFESLIYVECLAHSIKKIPVFELEPDDGSYQHPAFKDERTGRAYPCTIHIGYGMLDADTPQEFFDQVHHLLGHELQHMLSTTDKDWEAAQKMCFNRACDKLAIKAFGKPRRLTKDSDYEKFFAELADKGIFVNQQLLFEYIKYVLNVLEDGRIENIRTQLHPGFGNYRKTFRGKRWLEDDFRDMDGFKENPADLNDFDKLVMILGQLYPLATLGIYQRGFLAAYGGTDAHDLCASFIPEIAAAVLGKTCKECMDQGRIIFDRLLDMIVDVCSVEADAKAFKKFLEKLIDKLLEDLDKTKMSASPSTEEKGDGTPAESVFGQTELELEVDKETYEKLKEESELDDDSAPGVKVKVKSDSEDGDEPSDSEKGKSSGKAADTNSSENGEDDSDSEGSDEAGEAAESGISLGKSGKDSPASDKSGEPADNAGSESSDSGEEGNGDGSDSSSESSSDSANGSGEKSGKSSGGSDETDGIESADGLFTENNDTGSNNVVDSASESSLSEEEFTSRLEEAMEEAAKKASADFEIAEADAKLDEAFSKAAKNFKPVTSTPIPMGDIDARYAGNVKFTESVRKYDPTGRLPMELENKGKSLDRKIDQLIKNKQEPDLRFLRSGMLDTRRIANLAMGDIDVFKKKGEPVKSDVAGFLLMDNSGSMGNGPGSTRFACCNAFAVLEEGFKDHMPLKIAAFDANGSDRVMHEVIKEFDEVAPANLSYNFRDLGRSGWGNKDGYSIRVAAKQLSMRPEKDKILIIASDGFPTDYRGGFKEGIKDVKSAVEDARKAGIRTIGMYMYHDQNDEDFAVFREMYGQEIIFASLDEIEDELTRILQRYFH